MSLMRPGPLVDMLGAEWSMGAPVVALAWFATEPAIGFGLGDGTVALTGACWDGAGRLRPREGGGVELVPPEGPPPPVVRVAAHGGACTAMAAEPRGTLLSAGADGVLTRVARDGDLRVLGRHAAGGIDALAVAPDGACAFAVGRRLHQGDADTAYDLPAPVAALLFHPSGTALAAGLAGDGPEGVAVLSGGAWSGFEAAACGALAWSGGGHYLAAGTSAGVRCWRFPQADTVQLSGGPAAPSCVSFSADGGIVAVSGGSRAACWALGRADAPPAECGVPSSVAVTRVAFHPTRPVLALGYGSGAVLLGQPGSEGVLLVRGPGGGAIIALAWSADGEALAFGTEGGMIGLVRLPELLFRPATAAASPAARAGAPA